MNGHKLLATAAVPGGVELRLLRRGDQFTIALGDNELMSTRASASEEALAVLTCDMLAEHAAPQILIGGYGMGFTLRAVLAKLGADADVTVAELVPDVIAWARGPMRDLTDGCLEDRRVMLIEDDVAMLIGSAIAGYDGILLDVDNGPDGLTQRMNDQLYSVDGLKVSMRALKPGGVLAIWSAEPDARFTDRLAEAGFLVTQARARERANGKGANHVIWLARKARKPAREPAIA